MNFLAFSPHSPLVAAGLGGQGYRNHLTNGEFGGQDEALAARLTRGSFGSGGSDLRGRWI